MAPLPKKRHSTARQGKRRAAILLASPLLIICSNCKGRILPHMVCPHCGHYKGEEIVPDKKVKKLTKNENKKRPTTPKKDTDR